MNTERKILKLRKQLEQLDERITKMELKAAKGSIDEMKYRDLCHKYTELQEELDYIEGNDSDDYSDLDPDAIDWKYEEELRNEQ